MSTSSSFDYSTVFGPKRYYTYPDGNTQHSSFGNTSHGHLRTYVLNQPLEGSGLHTSLRYLQRDQYLALTWVGVVSGGMHSEPLDESEWDVFEDRCRMMYDEYTDAYHSSSPQQQASMPIPDYTLFTNNSAFANTLFSYSYHNLPVAKEFGPYIVRDIALITDDPSIEVTTYEVSYYKAENDEGVWCMARVEERAVLKLAPLRRDQDVHEDIRFSPSYSGHVQKCGSCGTWLAVHEARQCIGDGGESYSYDSDDDDSSDRATVVLVNSDDEGEVWDDAE